MRWIATSAVVALLAVSLAGCNKHVAEQLGNTSPSSPAATAPTADSSAAPVAADSTAATGAAATAAASSALAQVNVDLSGITVSVSQANTDLGAGDSERTKSDDPN